MAASDLVRLLPLRGLALVAGFPLLLGAGGPVAGPIAAPKAALGAAPNAAIVSAEVAREAVTVHDLHVSYADVAVEGGVLAARFRLFKDDLERAVGAYLEVDAVALTPGPEADALVLRYLKDHLKFEARGGGLAPKVLRSGEDLLDREPVWWVVVQYESEGPVDEIMVRNTLLMELFDDQRNVMKFVHFPDGTPRTFYFARGEEERRVRFD